MAGWLELIDPKAREETRTGLFFTRRFYQTPKVSSCHPVMYEEHPDSSLSLVQSIQITPLNKSNQIDQALVKYTPLDEETAQPPGTSFNDLPLTMQTGGEIFTQDTSGSDYFWLNAPINTRAHSDVQRRIATGDIEITEIIDSSILDVDSSTGAFKRSIIMSGRVNKATFRGLGPVNWLYNGANFDRFRNEAGELKYRVHHSFAFRLPDFPTQTDNGWRLIWREEEQQWDQLTDTPGGTLNNPIPYTSGDFSRVFTTSGAN